MAKPDLITLAERVSDGQPVDWESALRDSPERGAERVVRNLRLLESLSSFHRTLASGADEPVGGATRTVVSGDPAAVPRVLGASTTPFAWGPLEVRQSLGAGGFGEVFRAWDPTLQREVALKLLQRESYRSPRALGRTLHARSGGGAGFEASVLREARLLARVRHPNVAAVYGADSHEGRVGLWMELVRGRSLAQWVEEQGRLGAREAAVLGVDLCRALAAVHGAGLVHRDVKAGNVMREEGGRILLMDFGAMIDTSSPEEGSVSGTPRYIAPEIYAGASATPRSDLYSLGVLLYHLVTGRYPIEARTVGELRERIARRDMRLLRDERPDLPEGFVQVVERALAWSAEDRFATAGSMEQALSAFLGAESRAMRAETHGPDHEGTGAVAIPPARGRTPLLAAATLFAVLLLAALVVIVPKMRGGSRAGAPPGTSPPVASSQGEAPPGGAPSEGTASAGHGGAPSASAAAYSVEATLVRFGKDGRRERLDPDSRLALGDRLALEVRGSVPLHVYVIDEDDKGHAYALFPLPGLEPRNPVPAGANVLLPGVDAEGGQNYWNVTSAGGREHIMILASPDRIVEFEAEMVRLPRPEPGANAVAIPDSAMVRLRGLGGLVRSKGPAPARDNATNLFQMAERLAGASERVEGVWLRRIDLENPAP